VRASKRVFEPSRRSARVPEPPRWIEPQLSRLVETIPAGDGWAHEVKFDGYRMMARLFGGEALLLTRSGLDWTAKYPGIAAALRSLKLRQAYLDGELCAIRPDGTTSFADMQAAAEGKARLVYFAFDLLHLDGLDLMPLPLLERKALLERLLAGGPAAIRYSSHHVGDGPKLYAAGAAQGIEGLLSKQIDKPYAPGNRGLWVKTKFLNRQEFVIVGWSEPEGSREALGSLLLGYYADDGRLLYAGRAGTGMSNVVLRGLMRKLKPLEQKKMTVDEPPPKTSHFGRPLELARVHWVKPKLVAEVTYLTWTTDGLLRHVVFEGLRDDKPAQQVRRQG
jgi:bifunctional non-homologous end joining protein LigD